MNISNPENKYKAKRKSKVISKIILILLSLILVAGIIVSGFFIFKSVTKNKITINKIKEQWDVYNYQGVYELGKAYLQNQPYNNTALTYCGFAAFYLAVSQNDTYQSHEFLDESIINIRMAMYNAEENLIPQLEYMLGKAYFYKNSITKYYYADLAVKYLSAAKEHGYEAKDIAEYLGMSYASLGMTMESISAFSEALLYRESESLLLSIAEQYFYAKEYNSSEQYLYRIMNTSKNDDILQKCRNLLASLYLEKEDYDNAEIIFNEMLQYNQNTAEAYYGLGLVEEKQGNFVKARANWKQALKIQPNHPGALKKLSE